MIDAIVILVTKSLFITLVVGNDVVLCTMHVIIVTPFSILLIMLILSKNTLRPLRSLRLKSLRVVPLLQLSIEFKPRELRLFLDAIRHVLDMHRHAAARHERRPEEP